MEELKQKWDEIKELLRKEHEMLDIPFKTWILPLKLHDLTDNVLTIAVPNMDEEGTQFINKKYGLFLKVCIAEVINKEYELNFVTEKNINKKSVSSYNNINNTKVENANLNPKYKFENFVVGDNNNFAHSAALAVADSPGKVFNPLFLYSGPGLGKTHLMHSIGHYIIENNPELKVLYVTSETFTIQVIESIRLGNQAMNNLREKYRNVDVLLLDDVQFIIGKERTQEEFFNTFNELHSKGKAIILSSDRPPKEMETLELRLRTRFEWGLLADISEPKYETKIAILKNKASEIGYEINDDIIDYIASNIKTNIRELEGAFNKVIALCNMNRDKSITLAVAEEALKDLISPNNSKKITPEFITETVANYFNVLPDDIISKKRNKEIVIPRQIVMYLCKKFTDIPFTSIGKCLGNKDHATVMYGVNKIDEEISKNTDIKKYVDDIEKIINPS